MSAPELTSTTVRWLFATTWAPTAASRAGSIQVPGGRVPGMDVAANLLEMAIWNLREEGLAEVRQLRPVKNEPVLTMGGKSFSGVTFTDPETRLPGVEGAFLEAWRERREAKGIRALDEKIGDFLSPDDEDGLRGRILDLGLDSDQPWTSVGNYCRDEARTAGVIEVKGRLKKDVIPDPDALEELRPRDEKIARERKAYREREPELDHAVIADCIKALEWAYTTSSD